jgi:hypothetical protein
MRAFTDIKTYVGDAWKTDDFTPNEKEKAQAAVAIYMSAQECLSQK